MKHYDPNLRMSNADIAFRVKHSSTVFVGCEQSLSYLTALGRRMLHLQGCCLTVSQETAVPKE